MIRELTAPYYRGRGYVGDGMNLAARAIADSFKTWGLEVPPFFKNMIHPFKVSVNTFPGKLKLKLDKIELKAGQDYHVMPDSPPFTGKFKIIRLEDKINKGVNPQKAIFLINYSQCENDSCRKILKFKEDSLHTNGFHIVRVSHKHEPWYPYWKQARALRINIHPRAPRETWLKARKADISVESVFHKEYTCFNVMGYKKGEREDTFLVVTGHIDHLGMMGEKCIYPGANDNASGTAMMMALAKLFSAQKNLPYSMLFIGFGAEELGLAGSRAFVHDFKKIMPQIRFLLNLDLMGGGDKGVTLVNGVELHHISQIADSINSSCRLIAEVKRRSNAANSDHYFFTLEEVPAIFGFAMGEGIAYHDIHDTFEKLPMHNCSALLTLWSHVIRELLKPLPANILQPK